jgi:hypothetical protein
MMFHTATSRTQISTTHKATSAASRIFRPHIAVLARLAAVVLALEATIFSVLDDNLSASSLRLLAQLLRMGVRHHALGEDRVNIPRTLAISIRSPAEIAADASFESGGGTRLVVFRFRTLLHAGAPDTSRRALTAVRIFSRTNERNDSSPHRFF